MKTHGLSKTPQYRVWCTITQRIRDPNCGSYPNYGGRGLDIDPRWLDYENFLADMGERPPGMTIERIDNDRGYWPDNCRWDTRLQQGGNSRKCVMITYQGQAMHMGKAMRLAGLPSYTPIWKRLKRGMTNQEAFDDYLQHKRDHPQLHQKRRKVVKMPRRPSPDQLLGSGSSIWATTEARNMLFQIAEAEQRSVKVVLHRAIMRYAEASEDYQRWLQQQGKRRKAA